jgi:hypothetical protein
VKSAFSRAAIHMKSGGLEIRGGLGRSNGFELEIHFKTGSDGIILIFHLKQEYSPEGEVIVV